MHSGKNLRLEPGGKARRYYLLGLVIVVLFIPLSVWLYYSGSKWLAVLLFLISLEMLLALPHSRRWARPLELRGERLCRNDGCRDLAELAAARFEVRNAALLANMREGAIALEWRNGEVWRVPLSLCGWHELWERIRQLRPDLGLGDWREDETMRRILRRAWDMPFCGPEEVKPVLPKAGDWVGMMLVAAAVGAVVGVAMGVIGIYYYQASKYVWVSGFFSSLAATWYLRRRLAARIDRLGERES